MGMIRFLPESKEKVKFFNSILIISMISAFIFGLIFIAGINLFSPALEFLMKPWFIIFYLLFLIFQKSSGVVNAALLALRRADLSFAQNLGLGLRILLLIPLTFIGTIGIFGSLGIAFLLSLFIGIFLLNKIGIVVKPSLSMKEINGIIRFSFANYIADFLLIAESSILPILILNVIGAKEAAYFYVAFSIAGLLYAIPNSMFTSMFIEGCYGEPLRRNAIKSLEAIGIVIVPFSIVIYFYGDILLSLFSREYSTNAYEILKILVISSVFVDV